MASRADFTAQEWETLEKGVVGAGLMVTVADRGFFDTFKEAGALARHLAEARENNASPLVRELGEAQGSGFGLTDSPDEVERETTEALRAAVGTLQSKAPEELEAYRQLALEVAQSVAAAAGGGVAIEETGAIEKIRSALQ
jgi:hypothetical protein